MSLYGALFSGVSGLASQASAMGAISDNISNVNTAGYKGTQVKFATLITKQTASTRYSPGGVQSRPKSGIDVQGLLSATNSATDIGMSGSGFFVVNSQAQPSIGGGMFAYTRAGSFKTDKQGYLQNVGGFYMQGWPLQRYDGSAEGNPSKVVIEGIEYMKAYKTSSGSTHYVNQNIVSDTELQALNLTTIGGTATATAQIQAGANLPSGDAIGDTHETNVLTYDTLGNSHNLQFTWQKTAENNWSLTVPPPTGAAVLTLSSKNAAGTRQVYGAAGQLEFNSIPPAGSEVVVNGVTFQFHNGGADPTNDATNVVGVDLTGITNTTALVTRLKTRIDAASNISTFPTTANLLLGGVANGASRFVANDNVLRINQIAGADAINVDLTDTNLGQSIAQVATSNDAITGLPTALFTVEAIDTTFIAAGTPTTTTLTGTTTLTTAGATLANVGGSSNSVPFVATTTAAEYTLNTNLLASARSLGDTLTISLKMNSDDNGVPGVTHTITTAPLTTADLATDATLAAALQAAVDTYNTANGLALTVSAVGGTSFTVTGPGTAANQNITVSNIVPNDATVRTINLAGRTFEAGQMLSVDINGTTITTAALVGTPPTIADALAALKAKIEASGQFATAFGSDTAKVAISGSTLVLTAGTAGAAGDFTASDVGLALPTYTMNKAAVQFNGNGTPRAINVNDIQVAWSNGSEDLVGGTAIGLFLGNLNLDNGMTQLSGSYQVNRLTQDGARFGNFSGVSIAADGVVTALFDNGVRRPIFQIPVATFINPNGLEGLTGNSWIETDTSGQYTLRTAGQAGAGQVAAAAVEASTVDLGEEFTTMITTQRAYSAAAKIITTADEMLDELVRIKR